MSKEVLGKKLDDIAALIADEIINNGDELSILEKCTVLKTLDNHYTTIHKVEPSAEEGGGFARYRQNVAAASVVRKGNADRGGDESESGNGDAELDSGGISED